MNRGLWLRVFKWLLCYFHLNIWVNICSSQGSQDHQGHSNGHCCQLKVKILPVGLQKASGADKYKTWHVFISISHKKSSTFSLISVKCTACAIESKIRVFLEILSSPPSLSLSVKVFQVLDIAVTFDSSIKRTSISSSSIN